MPNWYKLRSLFSKENPIEILAKTQPFHAMLYCFSFSLFFKPLVRNCNLLKSSFYFDFNLHHTDLLCKMIKKYEFTL